MPQRNWLITGVSCGFGRIMTEQLLARGDRVAGTVRNLSVMDEAIAPALSDIQARPSYSDA
jgi:NAD(P)-dependent dehydrogenase (short-subunit alcohol dehydrogenase family)